MTNKNLYAISVPRESPSELRYFDHAQFRNGKLVSLKSTANPAAAWSTEDLQLAKDAAAELNRADNRSGAMECSVVPYRGNQNNPLHR